MKPAKLTASLLSISLLASGLTTSVQNSVSAKESKINQLLIQHGLNPTNCGPGVVAIWINLNEQRCAVPNAQYPAGTYRLTNDFQIMSVIGEKNSTVNAGNRTGSASVPADGNQTVTVNVGTPTGYPSMPAAGNSTAAVGYPPPTIMTPSIVSTINPSQSVSPVISAQINASLAAKGLTLASCSANPGVVIMMDSFMACAHPTPAYPPGRYSLAFR